MDITKTKSYKNIQKSFEGEAQALLKYTFYAEVAREEGKKDLAVLFDKMANNEREHARIWYKLLNNGFNTTEENIISAASGENFEWKKMYPAFAAQARKDGLGALAVTFERIASIECDHERQFIEASMALTENAKTIAQKPLDDNAKCFCVLCGNVEDTFVEICSVCGAKNSFSK